MGLGESFSPKKDVHVNFSVPGFHGVEKLKMDFPVVFTIWKIYKLQIYGPLRVSNDLRIVHRKGFYLLISLSKTLLARHHSSSI